MQLTAQRLSTASAILGFGIGFPLIISVLAKDEGLGLGEAIDPWGGLFAWGLLPALYLAGCYLFAEGEARTRVSKAIFALAVFGVVQVDCWSRIAGRLDPSFISAELVLAPLITVAVIATILFGYNSRRKTYSKE